MRPIDELKMEHQAVNLTLRLIEVICQRLELASGPVEALHIDQLLEFFTVFVDKCHHGKEEELFFPALEEAGLRREGGPIGVLLLEHQQGREYVRKMKAAFADYRAGQPAAGLIREARDYIALLQQHIDKEDRVLFPLAERVLADAKQTELEKGFAMIENTKIGPGRHEEFHQMLDHLQACYLK